MSDDKHQLAVELKLMNDDGEAEQMAMNYWALNSEGGWRYTVREVASMAKISQVALTQRLRVAVIARDPESPCDQCGFGMTAATRTELDQNRRLSATRSMVCTPCRLEVEKAEKQAAVERQERLVAEVQQRFGHRDQEPVVAQDLTLRQAVSLLALFRNPIDENYTCSIPLKAWVGEQYAARSEDGRKRITELWNAGLITVHPSTPPSAFGWVEKDDTERVGLYVDAVRWTVRGSGPTGSINAALVKSVRTAFAGSWPDSWQFGWADEWDAVMLEEATAYLELCMDEHNLGFNPGERTRDVLADALNYFSLGALYNFIWRAARDSAAYYQRGGVPKKQAANSAIGRIERIAERALAESWEVKAYRRDRRLPWSSVGTTFFVTLLGIGDPMTITPENVTLAKEVTPDESDETEDPSTEGDSA